VNEFWSFCKSSVPSHTLPAEPAPRKSETGAYVVIMKTQKNNNNYYNNIK
jgi:hypothetical protein